MLTSMRLTLMSSSATWSPSSLFASDSALIARSSCSSTSPPIESTELRTRSRSSLKRLRDVVPEIFDFHRAVSSAGPRLYGATPHRAKTSTLCGKRQLNVLPFPSRLLDAQRPFVALQRVLDDRETEARAAASRASARIHAIEALRDARDLLRRDPDAGVDDLEHGGRRRGAPDRSSHVPLGA
jgi:hypothetical protein